MSDEQPPFDETDSTGAGPAPQWRDDGTLVSGRFDDVYFSRDGGLAETRHVFLTGCDLPHRWQGRAGFTVAETGFGTGLNMLATWQAFRDNPGACQRLDFISAEAYPLTKADMARALAGWTDRGDLPADLSAQLLAQYPPPEPGIHRLVFDQGRVSLTLAIGDAAASFAAMSARVDAWFLDGFSPAKNPDMWGDEVMDQIRRLSAPDAVAASFTVARDVRDRLEARGFTVEKAAGFGRKRDCLRAHRKPLMPTPARPSLSVAIVGAGIAGSTVAAALADRGATVTVLDPYPDLTQAASGNPIGIVMPRLHLGADPVSEFNRAAWRFARAWYDRVPPVQGRPALNDCGVLQLARDGDEADRFQRLARQPNVASRSGTVVDGEQVRFLTGEAVETVAQGGLWLPEAGWVRPDALCQVLRDHPAITTRAVAVHDIKRDGSGWALKDNQGDVILTADIVVAANGLNSRQYGPLGWQPLRPKRGQITALAAEAGSAPACITTFGHYLSPVVDGRRVLGATYDRWQDTQPIDWPDPWEISDAANQAALRKHMPKTAQHMGPVMGNRAALRATTPDHLPLAGQAPHPQEYHDMLSGFYLLTGLGSTGLVTAPLCAEVIAAAIFDEPVPITRPVNQAIAPRRFIDRAAKRGDVILVAN
ncbi:MAG: bifunctional tRNA (5-methylaminomethyl-2-thiouridine)(34)-methyltransferase MnmD/FAD-dependent 5-carboxymethylaminomethyl-2-thiouridine(34) oxidoreductase MnmC [Pseudomonadota bacterium]